MKDCIVVAPFVLLTQLSPSDLIGSQRAPSVEILTGRFNTVRPQIMTYCALFLANRDLSFLDGMSDCQLG